MSNGRYTPKGIDEQQEKTQKARVSQSKKELNTKDK